MAAKDNFRLRTLIEALGLDHESFHVFLEWALSEHLIKVIGELPGLDASFFRRPDGLKAFRDLLQQRTRRQWSHHDLEAICDRVKQHKEKHYRAPISYEGYLKLLWQVPWRCAKCGAEPPEVSFISTTYFLLLSVVRQSGQIYSSYVLRITYASLIIER